jgi:glycosyltransferase involved in cell wall biosynthesis
MHMPTNTDFTVLICTRNRVETLRKTIAIVLEKLDSFPKSRLLVVDNASNDGTADYLEQMRAENPRIDSVHEPTLGLYNARAIGFKRANGDFILLLDDDMVPGDDWPGAQINELTQDRRLGAVGTAIYPIWDQERPEWMADLFMRNILYSVPPNRAKYGFPYYPSGGSLALRRCDVLKLYGSPERRKLQLGWGARSEFGDAVGGDDWDMCEIYLRNGFAIKVLEHVRVGHRTVAGKLSPEWILRKFENDGRLRVRYARLAGYPILSKRVLALMMLFPALSLMSHVTSILKIKESHALVMRAYARKARGVWRELLWGIRGVRLQFDGASLLQKSV